LRRSAALKEWLRLFDRHFILRNVLVRAASIDAANYPEQ